YAVGDSRNIAPSGWHVATDSEWTTLSTFLGGESIAGDKLKEIGTSHWLSPNTGATNSNGFTAFPGGYRFLNGPFFSITNFGYWWSSTECSTDGSTDGSTLVAWNRSMSYRDKGVYRLGNSKVYGFSVRCLQD
ncbi:MAG: fibrobacter succinogenes major paralogous domain-containing protein, partial [Mariniphaga sp.]